MNINITLKFPEGYQGTEKSQELMKIVAEIKKPEIKIVSDYLIFSGIADKEQVVRQLQQITNRGTSDIYSLAKAIQDKFNNDVELEVSERKNEAQRAYDELEKKAKTASQETGLLFEVSSETDYDKLWDDDAGQEIYSLKVNDENICSLVSMQEVSDAISYISFGAKKADDPYIKYKVNASDTLIRDIINDEIGEEPEVALAMLEIPESIDIELNACHSAKTGKAMLAYFICRYAPGYGDGVGEWGSDSYADYIAGVKAYPDTDFIRIGEEGWEDRLKSDMARVLRLVIVASKTDGLDKYKKKLLAMSLSH